MTADLAWRVRSNVGASLSAYVFDGTYDAYHHARFGDAASDTTRVTVARLEWPIRSLTASSR